MSSFYLILCLMVDSHLMPIRTLNAEPYTSINQCEEVLHNPIVNTDYKEVFGQNIVLICRKV